MIVDSADKAGGIRRLPESGCHRNPGGKVMGMRTIAGYVENDQIKGMLRETGVDYAQGYGIGMPRAFNELLGCDTNATVLEFAKASGKVP